MIKTLACSLPILLLVGSVFGQTKTFKIPPADPPSQQFFKTNTSFVLVAGPEQLHKTALPLARVPQLTQTELRQLPMRLEFERERMLDFDINNPRNIKYEVGKMNFRLRLPLDWRLSSKFRVRKGIRPGMFEITFKKRF